MKLVVFPPVLQMLPHAFPHQPPSADGETICQSKVTYIPLNRNAEVGVTWNDPVLPLTDEKMCLLNPEPSCGSSIVLQDR